MAKMPPLLLCLRFFHRAADDASSRPRPLAAAAAARRRQRFSPLLDVTFRHAATRQRHDAFGRFSRARAIRAAKREKMMAL